MSLRKFFGLDDVETPRELQLKEAIKALQERNNNLNRHIHNLMQDTYENAFVSVSFLDAARQAVFELNPEHPVLKNAPPNFGVWEAQRNHISQLEEQVQFHSNTAIEAGAELERYSAGIQKALKLLRSRNLRNLDPAEKILEKLLEPPPVKL